MLFLTLMAAGVAAAATVTVVSRSNRPLPPAGGNVVSVLCLCAPESSSVFRQVVESELDLTAGDRDHPGYRLVFREVSAAEPADRAARLYESAFAATLGSDLRGYAGAVLDAAGLRAFAAAHASPGPFPAAPSFVVSLSPAVRVPEGEGPAKDLPHWSCAAAKTSAFEAPTLAAAVAALRSVPASYVLEGIATTWPTLAREVTAMPIPDRGFLLYDETTVCRGTRKLKGGSDAAHALRLERLATEADRPADPLLPAAVLGALAIDSTRGMKLLGGRLKSAVDVCVGDVRPAPEAHAVQRLMDRGDTLFKTGTDAAVAAVRAARGPAAATGTSG